MAALLPMGFLQFLDNNGDPLSGGSVTYEDPAAPGNFKAIWADEAATIPVQNPVPLDQAGRPFSGGSEVGIWGTGQYRMFVKDLNGALQWSAITSVITSDSGLAAETAARIAADNNLQTQISNEVTRATTAENNLATALNNAINTLNTADTNLQNEINALQAEDTNLQNQINALVPGSSSGNVFAMTGSGTTGGAGEVNVIYGTAFPHHTVSFIVDIGAPAGLANFTRFALNHVTNAQAIGTLEVSDSSGVFNAAILQAFNWYASGY